MSGTPQKLILRNSQSPGDVLMLTAAVRDLHRTYPGAFLTDVRTACPSLWEGNPYLRPIPDGDRKARVIDCEYPLIHESNRRPYHFIHGFIQFLNDRLDLEIRATEFKADIHLSEQEKAAPLQLEGRALDRIPFWIVNAGGKYDFTAKWWSPRRYQAVVDELGPNVTFVQIGEAAHHHPKLRGVVDLVGRTSLRQLVNLMYHAAGVITSVSLPMHLAAAVAYARDPGALRPCVVIAGGREPPHWEAYPGHQFLHTVGMLPCCKSGGCWRSRVKPLGDGSDKDRPEALCLDVVGDLPHCLDLISADEVIRRLSMCLSGMRPAQAEPRPEAAPLRIDSRGALEKPGQPPLGAEAAGPRTVSEATARRLMDEAIGSIPPCPDHFRGRGIVVCAGGRYLPGAWILLKMLHRVGCTLPVQLWHLGQREFTAPDQRLFESLGVECVDAEAIRREHPVRTLKGWELKPYAILHSRFREVLYLDADNFPLIDPEGLFAAAEYARAGTILWPDLGRLAPDCAVWGFFGLSFRDEPEVESGQIVIDKARAWPALCLTMWLNENSDFFYRYVHGDKETFHLAFRKCGMPYAMPRLPVEVLDGALCQHDFQGLRILQHRIGAKWSAEGPNRRIPGFRQEERGFEYLEEFRRLRHAAALEVGHG